MPTRSELVALNAAIKKYFGSPAPKQLVAKTKDMRQGLEVQTCTSQNFVTPSLAHLSNLQIHGAGMVLMAAKPHTHNPSLVLPSLLRTPTTPSIQMHMFAASALNNSATMARA